MANGSYSFTPFDFSGIQGDYSPLDQQYYEKEGAKMKEKQDPLFSMEELGGVYPLCSEYGACQDDTANKGLQYVFRDQEEPQPQPLKSTCLTSDECVGTCFPAPAQAMQEVKNYENVPKSSKELSHPFTLSSSLELLNNYGSGFKRLNLNQVNNASNSQTKLSTEEIMRVAGARYIQFSDQRYDDFSMLMHPFGYALSGLSEEETRDVELAHLLLAAAEKVGYQQFDRASRLLSRCEWIASQRANPVQRVVYCFAEALRERIDKATGRFIPKERTESYDIPDGTSLHLACLSFHQNVPLNQITQLTSIQAIMENIGSARKLQVIDLEIRSGVQWTAMMQALAERQQRPLEHLKVTALGLTGKGKKIEETGRSLESFAKSMNIPFTFKAVYVSCMKNIKEKLFEIAADESLVVVSNMFLRTLISSPECLENLMRVIKNLKPSIMVINEIEANHNSPNFVNRFIEALFFYSAYFDCLETCLDHNNEHKSIIEALYSRGIRETVAMGDNERISRNVKIDVWRAFFSRFRMVEIGFSESALYQASLVCKQFACGSSCSLDKNGKCLIVGWKGTPLHSLSAWKFCGDRLGRFFPNYRF
ncbi:DELLA protein RGL1 [Ricinus communis]|nr:DELLA protein RGL1 [Ricinus communis]XP_048226433.1 DELLA protein RGL1 [Ricinus communis]|eukprot:XP_015572330.1 DELLA protein RGL1 [Ricinus communis]